VFGSILSVESKLLTLLTEFFHFKVKRVSLTNYFDGIRLNMCT